MPVSYELPPLVLPQAQREPNAARPSPVPVPAQTDEDVPPAQDAGPATTVNLSQGATAAPPPPPVFAPVAQAGAGARPDNDPDSEPAGPAGIASASPPPGAEPAPGTEPPGLQTTGEPVGGTAAETASQRFQQPDAGQQLGFNIDTEA